MPNKKAQLTIFVIIGVIILTAAFFYISNRNIKLSSDLTSSGSTQFKKIVLQPIRVLAERCLREALIEAIGENAQKGMYYDTPNESSPVFSIIYDPYLTGPLSIDLQSRAVPFYIVGNKSTVPDNLTIETELSKRIKIGLTDCIESDEYSINNLFSYDFSKLDIKTTIEDKAVASSIVSPFVVLSNDSQTEISDISGTIEYSLYEKVSIVNLFIDEQFKDLEYEPLGYLTGLANKNKFNFSTSMPETNLVLYTLNFNDFSNLSKEPLSISFLIGYDWISGKATDRFLDNYSISLEAEVGYPFIYTFLTNRPGITFKDYTPLFDIGVDNGTISFIPKIEYTGNYSLLISMTDNESNEDFVTMNMDITNDKNPPIIEEIPDAQVAVGTEFRHKVNVTNKQNETIFFSDDSNLFDIDVLTGEIDFIPSEPGYSKVRITATDLYGQTGSNDFYLRIKDES